MGPEIPLGFQERHLAPGESERPGAGEPDHPTADDHGVQPLDRHTANLPPAPEAAETKGTARHPNLRGIAAPCEVAGQAAACLIFAPGHGRERDPKLAECDAPSTLLWARSGR